MMLLGRARRQGAHGCNFAQHDRDGGAECKDHGAVVQLVFEVVEVLGVQHLVVA